MNNKKKKMGVASVNKLEDLLTDKNYQIYNERKQKIKSKYSEDCFPNHVPEGWRVPRKNITQAQRKEYLRYLKEVSDLLLKPNGPYQKFTWDYLTPPRDKKTMDVICKGTSR